MNLHRTITPLLEWEAIANSLDTFIPSTGGFTNAKRGFVTLENGDVVFIKIGIDDSTKLWANKEALVYNALAECNFEYIPKLLSVNKDATGFALENLSSDDGWEWETRWSQERLSKTLEAMDALALLAPTSIPPRLLEINMVNEQRNPWSLFLDDPSAYATLQNKLEKLNRHDLLDQIAKRLKNKFDFNFAKDALVHNDVRRDNCAWNPRTKQVRLIDWNWLQLGSRSVDVNSLLVNAHKSGLNLAEGCSDRLDKDALLWLAGYWFNATVQAFDGNISENTLLRDYQLESAVSAYDLMLGL